MVYLEDKEVELTSFKVITKVHEINNHKRGDQLLSAYSRAEWMSPDVIMEIRKVVHSFKISLVKAAVWMHIAQYKCKQDKICPASACNWKIL